MRFHLLFVGSLLLVLFVAGGLGSVAPVRAETPNDVCADFNGDGQVGISDIGLVVQRFGMTEESPNWDPRFDLHRGTISSSTRRSRSSAWRSSAARRW